MSTKKKLADILSRVDTEEARDAIMTYRSEWSFRFRNENEMLWSESPSYRVTGFLDEEEATTACLVHLWDCVDDQEFYAYRLFEVEITNDQAEFRRTLSCRFSPEGSVGICQEPENDQDMRPS